MRKYSIAELKQYVEDKHSNQQYGTESYFFGHIMRVVGSVEDMKERIISDVGVAGYNIAIEAAYLHDVIEDTDTPLAEIKGMFGDRVGNVVAILTKQKDQSYVEYIRNVLHQKNRVAYYVKLADLNTNIRQSDIQANGATKSSERYIARLRKDKYEMTRYIIELKLNERELGE